MGNALLGHIEKILSDLPSEVVLIENNDGFLFRDDVVKHLELRGMVVCAGTVLQQRIEFELKELSAGVCSSLKKDDLKIK